MVSLAKSYIRYVLDAQEAYRGAGMMMALYFLALIIILALYQDKKKKAAMLLPSMVLIAFVYLGVPLFNTVNYYLEFFDGRLFWTLITPVITAIGLTVFISGISDKRDRIIAICILVPAIVYCGKFMISDAIYKESTNQYKLPQEAVDVTEYITSEMDSPIIIMPYTIVYPFRQISTDVYPLYGEDATSWRIMRARDVMFPICEEMERVTPDLNMIVPKARELNVDYIMFDTVYTELCENGNINIYGYPADPNYVGDRTSTIDFDDLIDVSVIDDEKGIYWDLSAYGLSYEKTFGQYILYRVD